jgi:hypothetical protein
MWSISDYSNRLAAFQMVLTENATGTQTFLKP